MKYLFYILVFMNLTIFSAFAQLNTKITERNIKAFIELFPQYNANNDGSFAYAITAETKKELQALLKKYGFTTTEYTALLQKISLGLPAIQMEQHKISTDFFGLAGKSPLSKSEMAILRKHKAELENVLGATQ